jgi:uncharacterized protein YhaN
MNTHQRELLETIELQAEILSMNLVETITQLKSKTEEAAASVRESGSCFEDAVTELCQEVDLTITAGSEVVHMMEEITMEIDAVSRLRAQVQAINRQLDVLEKNIK